MEKSITEYYNGYTHQLVNDYIKNNIRVDFALQAISFLVDEFKPAKILDLGCGIGWSAHEISRLFPESQVEGFDLSPELIKIGNDLFKSNNLQLQVKDLTISDNISSNKFELVSMIDVFEHIPAGSREHFAVSLKKNLGENFMIFFSCPTIKMQNHLKATNPKALQPVDEDIDESVLTDFANILNGNLVFYKELDIWREGDYLHAVISNKQEKLQIEYGNSKYEFESRGSKIKRILWSNQKIFLSGQNLTTKLQSKFYRIFNLH